MPARLLAVRRSAARSEGRRLISLEIHDGPFLELGLKGIVGQVIDRPRRLEDRPDRDRLALRFEQFKKAA
jgi:hypothetical protein